MEQTSIELLSLAEHKLSWLARRQELLAQDVANGDTPGYVSRDLKPFAAHVDEFRIIAERTSPAHLDGSPEEAATDWARSGMRAPDGNAVSLDGVLTEMADTDASQELTSSIYKKYISLFRTALGR